MDDDDEEEERKSIDRKEKNDRLQRLAIEAERIQRKSMTNRNSNIP